ncbi:MAG: HAMP domain-containing sensor histidine kinase [Cyanobacteria bacterium J06581_3]
MKELADVLRHRSDAIIEVWGRDVRRNIKNQYPIEMTYEAIRSRLPLIIEAIATGMSSDLSSPVSAQVNLRACEESGTYEESGGFQKESGIAALAKPSERLTIPVKLGFDIAEMLREFAILRTLLLIAVKCDFGAEDATSSILAVKKIDQVLNSIATQAVQDNTDYQLERVEPMHRELLASNQELIRLVQTQKDNASHLAHELKNPLHAIISFSSILLRKKQKELAAASSQASDQANEIKQIERIFENGQRMSALITNMLEASRQEYQNLSLNVEVVEVAQLIDRVVESLEAEARKKNISLTRERSLTLSNISTDSLRLQQIIVNLVSNAIRYTDEGTVTVRCYIVDDSHWAIAVRDTGRGIGPTQQEEIFAPYVRVGSTASHVPESTGLGLTIVSKLVDLLQGKIELVSELGKGSTFTVTLPVDYATDRC